MNGLRMIEIKKPKIGLVGMMAAPFRGDKESNYRSDRTSLDLVAKKLDFELFSIEEGIYSLEEANAAANQIADWGADFVLLQTSSFASGDFLYPFLSLQSRLGIWAVPEGPPTAEGGLPLNSFTAANMYNSIIQKRKRGSGLKAKWFFGHPGQPLFDDRFEITIKALRSLVNLVGLNVALIGGVAPSFDNLNIDEDKLFKQLGIKVVNFDLGLLIDRAKAIGDPEARRAAQSIKNELTQFDPKYDQFLDKSGRIYQAVVDLAEEHNLAAVGLSCWPSFQEDYDLAVCTVMGHLNSAGLIAACEGDITSAISMLQLYFMTKGQPVTLMDLATMDQEDDSVLLWHCGPTSPKLADENGTTAQPLWLFDKDDGTQVGLHNDLILKPGPCTVMGFTTEFDGLLIFEGEIDNKKSSYMGSRGWLKNIKINTSSSSAVDLIQTLMSAGFQHHYPLTYGHLGEAGMELCSWLGIEPLKNIGYTNYLR